MFKTLEADVALAGVGLADPFADHLEDHAAHL
jgi:hypothetical protein